MESIPHSITHATNFNPVGNEEPTKVRSKFSVVIFFSIKNSSSSKMTVVKKIWIKTKKDRVRGRKRYYLTITLWAMCVPSIHESVLTTPTDLTSEIELSRTEWVF